MSIAGETNAVAERVDARLTGGDWDLRALDQDPGEVSAAAEVAVFALRLAGKRRQARRGGRFGRLVVGFALAACVALATVAAACDKPDANPEATSIAISELPSDTANNATVTAQPRAGPAQFSDMVLVDPGSNSQPWATLTAKGGDAPIVVDGAGAGLDTVGNVYRLAAQPVPVGTRDGPAQFLGPLQPAVSTGSDPSTAAAAKDQLTQRWNQDERYLAPTRAISGQLTVLDAAYNAAAAAAAGGTHTYNDGVVLRLEPDQPVLQVIDKALLESGRPTRAEDVVYVAIRPGERSLYDPGQVVNLRDVVMDRQDTTVDGQPTTVYTVNAALDGARVEPTGKVDLQSLLQPRLQRVDQDVALQTQTPAAGTPGAQVTATPGATASSQQQQVIVQQGSRGPSFVDDFLIYMWLSNTGFFRGSTTIINNPPYSAGRPSGDVYYSAPPSPGGSTPSTIASSQAASRSTALQAARGTVSGQASGTGGGVAATNKSAADASARVGAATGKAAAVAGAVSAASVGKSIASAPSSSSSTASRSAGSTSAGSGSSLGSSSSSRGIGGLGSSSSSSGSSGGFGGKGIGGSGGSA